MWNILRPHSHARLLPAPLILSPITVTPKSILLTSPAVPLFMYMWGGGQSVSYGPVTNVVIP